MRTLRKTPRIVSWASILFLCCTLLCRTCSADTSSLTASYLWRYEANSGCEIVCYAPVSGLLYVTVAEGICVLDARSGEHRGTWPAPVGFHATSIAHSDRRLAVAWAAMERTEAGKLTVYDVSTSDGTMPRELGSFPAGFLPDMVTFSSDGRWLLSANEGEPSDDYKIDPEGSVTAIDISAGVESAEVHQLSFKRFNKERERLRSAGVRVFGPSATRADQQATVAEDLEPEYIAVSEDSTGAWVSLQENNALAEIDLEGQEILAIHPLGEKSFELNATSTGGSAVGLDASDADGGARIRHWPIHGLFQPDSIGAVQVDGIDYLLTVNEGDPRNYEGFNECDAVGALAASDRKLDDRLKESLPLGDEQLGRLEVSTTSGDDDNDGDLDRLCCFGTRSFSVRQIRRNESPELVFDSGHDFEWISSRLDPTRYNADSEPNALPDERSPKRGPEPEGLAIGMVGARRIAAIGLERTGGVMLYDITMPTAPEFLEYIPALKQAGKLDCAPEGLLLISASENSLGKAMLVVCYEKSHTVTAYTLDFE